MYVVNEEVKNDPHRRWAWPDRIFFGFGACHILAGAFLDRPPLPRFYAERIVPAGTYPGNHIYVTDGEVAFDFRGYSRRERLLEHHWKVWFGLGQGRDGRLLAIDFDLLSSADLNARKMRGPDQYLQNAIPRARKFIEARDHRRASAKARAIV